MRVRNPYVVMKSWARTWVHIQRPLAFRSASISTDFRSASYNLVCHWKLWSYQFRLRFTVNGYS